MKTRMFMLLTSMTLLLQAGLQPMPHPRLPPQYVPNNGTPFAAKDYKVKLAMLGKLHPHFMPPKRPFPKHIVLGVLGRNVFGRNLVEPTLREIPGRKMVTTVIGRPADLANCDCDILFLPATTPPATVQAVMQITKGRPVLIVGESKNALKSGCVLNFVIRGGGVKMQLKKSHAKDRKLTVSGPFLQLVKSGTLEIVD